MGYYTFCKGILVNWSEKQPVVARSSTKVELRVMAADKNCELLEQDDPELLL